MKSWATKIKKNTRGQTLIELLLVMALVSVFLPSLLTGLVASREGASQQKQRQAGVALLKESEEIVRNIRNTGWTNLQNGTFHPGTSGNQWTLVTGTETINDFTRQIVVEDVLRDDNGTIATSGGSIDPSTKKVTITISWSQPYATSLSSSLYFTRYLENTYFSQTSQAEFNAGTLNNVTVTNTAGGEVILADNVKAKWCEPEFSSSVIDLPDGPPVAVAATASASITTPNDVLVATAPVATSSVKLAYVNVTANTDPPVSTLFGTFTLDSSKYSSPSYVPSGIGITNTFRTNDVKYYKSPSNKIYALIATDLPSHEIIAILVNDNDPGNDTTTTGEYADPVNKIYKYHTFFNTRRYEGNTQSTPNQDQAPWDYGAVSVAVLGDRGYAASGGYLYIFNLSNIDSKTTSSGLDMIGCRIQLDGYDCRPGSPADDEKYGAGQTGTSYSDIGSAAHNDCSDGGNIELYATNDLFPIQVGTSTYVYVAIGAGTNPEFGIVNATNIPTGSTSPTISNSSCGRISGGASGWRRISSLDFNSQSNTEEAANSVFGKSDGSRAYISSNGGIDANGNGQPDSKQFYVINTSTKTSPVFLSGTSATGATSGFYYGASPEDELYPKRSLTVLNGQRAVLVGKDGTANSDDAKEYQVLNISAESAPTFCGSVNFDSGFNDLTSVTEADGDNYVYMVANTTSNELKIIQGGPDGQYVESGTFESSTFTPGYATAYNRIVSNINTPSGTSLQFQVAVADAISGSCNGVTYNFVGPDGSNASYFSASDTPIFLQDDGTGYENPGRCFRYKAFLSTTSYDSTPTFYDTTVNYSP